MYSSMRSRAAILTALVGATMLMLTPATAQSENTATVTVIHAIPADDGFPADVYLNGELAIDGFVFESKTDALSLPAGDADLEIYPDGSDPAEDDAALTETVTFQGDVDYTLVASLVDGAPVLSIFENDTSQLGAGQARLTVRQTSVQSSLDILLDGDPVAQALAAPQAASVDLDSGTYSLSFSSGDQTEDRSVELAAGQVNIFYAVGSLDDGTFDVLTQTVVAAQETPEGVPTGTGGAKGAPPSWLTVAAATLLGVTALGARRRVRSSQ